MNLSTSVLALLVALVSVISLAAPVMVGLFEEQNSRLSVVFQQVREDRLFFAASNGGTRPGTMGPGGHIHIRDGDEIVTVFWFRQLGTPSFIEAGKSISVEYTLWGEQEGVKAIKKFYNNPTRGVLADNEPIDSSADLRAVVEVQSIDFYGSRKPHKTSISFGEFYKMLIGIPTLPGNL